jgi:hypothetical protein
MLPTQKKSILAHTFTTSNNIIAHTLTIPNNTCIPTSASVFPSSHLPSCLSCCIMSYPNKSNNDNDTSNPIKSNNRACSNARTMLPLNTSYQPSIISYNGSSWRPSSISIPASPGLPEIDLMTSFSYETFRNLPSTVKQIKLPPDVYPPTWDQKTTIENIIINHASKQSGTLLIRGRSLPHRLSSYLICKYGRTYYQRQTESKQPSHSPQYKENIRRDVMVNKASAKRGIVRNEGKSLLRRSTTSKPSPDSLCPFKIILCLSPGSHWFIQGQSTACAVHNHLHPSSFESTPSTTRLTQPERTLLQCAQKYAHAGSVQNMMSDLTGCIYSKQQIYHIKNSVEEQSDNDTSKLMNYLRQQAELGYLRYKALFHEVTQSTLITVEQARKRKHQAAMETLTSHITDDDWTLAASLSNIDIQLHTSASLGAGISEAEIPFQLDNNDANSF